MNPYRLFPNPVAVKPQEGFLEAPEEEAHLRDYGRVVLKHRRLVVCAFLTCVLTVAVVIFTMTPQYTATTTIQIERQSPKVAPVQEVQPVEPFAGYDKYDYYQTQFEILQSRTVAMRVIQTLDLGNDHRFVGDEANGVFEALAGLFARRAPAREADGTETNQDLGIGRRLVRKYGWSLSVEPVRSSRLVKVSFTSPSRDLSAEVANKHVEEYVNASLEERLGTTQRAKEFLEEELAKSKDRVVAAEAALNKFRKEKGIISLDGSKSDVVSERLEDLNKRFTAAQADRIKLGGQYSLIQKRDYESLPDVVASPLVSQLKQEVSKIEAERAELSKKFKSGYPKMAETMAREAQAKARLGDEIRKIVSGLESAYLAAKTREAEVGKQLAAQQQAALSQKDVGADYDTLKRDVDTARTLYASLLHRLKDVDVVEQIKVSNVSVVDRAEPPLAPSRPRKLIDLALASVIGLVIGIGGAFFLEYLDNTLKTPEDVERWLGLPTLGVVPAFDLPALAYGTYGQSSRRRGRRLLRAMSQTQATAKKSGPNDVGATELIVSQRPRSVVSEAYRTIRTGVLLSSADAPPRIVLFTSGSTGEGKTITAVNHALTLVDAGARVILLDCDIRKPRLHRIFQIPNGHGMSTYLTGQSSLESVVHAVATNDNGAVDRTNGSLQGNLWVIPSGPLPPNPAELLGSERMRETLALLREHYDYVVIDTPPILPVTDTALLATMSDGVVLVVRGQTTPVYVAQKARDRLEYVRAKILGVVLNDVDVTTGDYSHYQRYYYSYYSEGSSIAEDAPLRTP